MEGMSDPAEVHHSLPVDTPALPQPLPHLAARDPCQNFCVPTKSRRATCRYVFSHSCSDVLRARWLINQTPRLEENRTLEKVVPPPYNPVDSFVQEYNFNDVHVIEGYVNTCLAQNATVVWQDLVRAVPGMIARSILHAASLERCNHLAQLVAFTYHFRLEGRSEAVIAVAHYCIRCRLAAPLVGLLTSPMTKPCWSADERYKLFHDAVIYKSPESLVALASSQVFPNLTLRQWYETFAEAETMMLNDPVILWRPST